MLIAQISDLHLRGDGSLLQDAIDTRRALENCIAHVNGLNPRPDIVLATGDLVDLALPHDYAVLRAMLNRLEMPLYVIPGNHDDREAMRRTFGDVSYLRDCEAFLHYTVEPYPLRLIGLDTMLPGEVRGGLCANRLHWLADRLAEQPDRPTLIFIRSPAGSAGRLRPHPSRPSRELGGDVRRRCAFDRLPDGLGVRPRPFVRPE